MWLHTASLSSLHETFQRYIGSWRVTRGENSRGPIEARAEPASARRTRRYPADTCERDGVGNSVPEPSDGPPSGSCAGVQGNGVGPRLRQYRPAVDSAENPLSCSWSYDELLGTDPGIS